MKYNQNNSINKGTGFRKIINALSTIVLLSIFFIILPGLAGMIESHYSNTAIVTEINADEILIEDTTGNIWGFFGEGYIVGDKVNVVWNDKHTETREDDEIIKVIKID